MYNYKGCHHCNIVLPVCLAIAVTYDYLPYNVMNSKLEHHFCCYTPAHQEKKSDTPRFLVTLDVGIGDAVAVGLSAIDQIVENDSFASGAIDVLCNQRQAQIFERDPRINQIIETSEVFFPGMHITEWLRGIILKPEASHVAHFLRQRHYEAVFPSIIAPGLYARLHARMMCPSVSAMAKNVLALHCHTDIHVSTIVRQMVNHYFRKSTSRTSLALEHLIPLYTASRYIQKARYTMASLKKEASFKEQSCTVVMVAPDTASAVTRPPIDLLAVALSEALITCPHLLVVILPSYTETSRSSDLLKALSQNYAQRVFLLPAEPVMHILETVALIDQSDVFITGDTGVMHLAAAHKQLGEGDDRRFSPGNSVKIIALFGGTNPGYYGYSKRSIILGRGRKEQHAFRPGFSKESYNPRGRNLFDHISPHHIADAILAH